MGQKPQSKSVFLSSIPRKHSFMCLLYRRDLDDIPEEQQEYINIISETFQNAVRTVTVKSCASVSEFHITCFNIEIPGSDKLLWTAMHYLIAPDSTAAMEIHNFDMKGSTIDIEKYVVTNICSSITRDVDCANLQEIVINGIINNEIL